MNRTASIRTTSEAGRTTRATRATIGLDRPVLRWHAASDRDGRTSLVGRWTG